MNFGILFTLAVFSAVTCSAQRVQPAKPAAKVKQDIEIQAPLPRKDLTISTNVLGPEKKTTNQEPAYTFSGLFVDVAHSTNRWKMFSLRRKVNLEQDSANLLRELRTEGGAGFKLFSIDFK